MGQHTRSSGQSSIFNSPSVSAYSKLLHSATAPTGTIDRAKSLAGWQEHAIRSREDIMTAKAGYAKREAEIKAEFQPEAASIRLAPIQAEIDGMVQIARQRLEEELEEVLEAKRAQFSKSLDAPSEDAIRLLTALSFRDDITPAEAGSIASKLGGNLHALKAFGSILKKSGLTMPPLLTEEYFERDLSEAKSYCTGMLNAIGKDRKDMNYREAEFFSAPGKGFAARAFGDLDSTVFTAAQFAPEDAPEAVEGQNTGNPSGKAKPATGAPESGYNATEIGIQGYESAAVIIDQFGVSMHELRKCNPEIDLDKPLYFGQKLIVPATHMKYSTEKGAVNPDACRPVHYSPEEARQYREGEDIRIQ